MALGMWESKEFLKTVLIVSRKSNVLANTVLFYYNHIRQRFNSKSCGIVMWSIEVRREKGKNGWKAKANPSVRRTYKGLHSECEHFLLCSQLAYQRLQKEQTAISFVLIITVSFLSKFRFQPLSVTSTSDSKRPLFPQSFALKTRGTSCIAKLDLSMKIATTVHLPLPVTFFDQSGYQNSGTNWASIHVVQTLVIGFPL